MTKLYLTHETKGLISTSEILNDTKEFKVNCGSHTYFSPDREITVFHKRKYKTIAFKDLWQKMTVFDVLDRKPLSIVEDFDVKALQYVLSFFQSFDENTGNSRNFLYKYSEDQTQLFKIRLNCLSVSKISVIEDDGVVYIDWDIINDYILESGSLDFLFALLLVYGRLQSKWSALMAWKIHIPSFGQFTKQIEMIQMYIADLATNGVYIDSKLTDSNDGQILEIVVNDYEVLTQFAHWHKPIERFDKITKKERVERHADGLIEFLQKQDIDDAWIELIKKATLKPLMTT